MLMSFVAIGGCSHRAPAPVAPEDPFVFVGFSQLPANALAGGGALLFPVGSVIFGDSVASLALRRGDLLDRASAVLDSVFQRDVRGVTWHDREAIRRVLRRSPNLGPDPTDLPTGFLLAKKVEAIPDPLWASIRALAAVTGARVAVIPVAVRLDGREGAVTATFAIAIVDVRLGELAWRGRVTGVAAATAEQALLLAAAAEVPTGIR